MEAITQDRYGPPEVLRVREVDRPRPREHEVLVRVAAAGVNRATWHVMTGKPYLGRLAFGVRRPSNPIPGLDVAGTVASVGAAVTAFERGDRVVGFGRGTFAEYAVARDDRLTRMPVSLSYEEAASVPISGTTALQALVDVGRVQPDQSVLVVGASGGVGSLAVQLAKGFGAEVTGVCSTGKRDLVWALGADHVVDYTAGDFADGRRRYDLVLDIAGNSNLARLRRLLRPRGTVVIVGGELGGSFSGGMNRQVRALAVSPFLKQRMTMFVAKRRASDLAALVELMDAGTVAPCVERSYPLRQAAVAMHRLETGRVRGSVVLTLS